MIRRRPLALVLVLAAALGSAATVHAAGIKLGKPAVDPAPQPLAVAEQPLRFSVAGAFKPPDADAQPWIRFVWNFGDGTVLQSPTYFGDGVHTDVVNHVYAEGGTYTVTVTGGHGFDFFGFRFQRSKTFKVQVACAGMDPGPKKCAKGTFTPFTGVWKAIDGPIKGATLTLEHFDKRVVGALVYKGTSGELVNVTVNGKMKYKAKDGEQVLLVDFDDTFTVATEKIVVEGRLIMDIEDDSALAYRRIGLLLADAPEAPEEFGATFVLEQRAEETSARLCNTIAAGKRSVKPGTPLAFAVVVANEGLASLPADRARMDIVVEGGTIVPDPLILERARPREAVSPTNLNVNFATLGAGKGQQNALSEMFFAVVPNPGARQISVTTTLFDDPSADDAPFLLQAPPVRRLCVPVVE